MQQSCKQCAGAYEVTEDDMAFYDKVSPVFGGKKYAVPPPTLCPPCRHLRRMIWRNERHLYNRPCELCNKIKISIFAPESPYHTYCHGCWWSDAWDPFSFGREYDVNRSFAENIDGFLKTVPLMMLYQTGVNENCDYTNFFGPDSRNCYLIFNSGRDEDCAYSRGLLGSKSCLDITIGSNDQYCYECVNASNCYRVFYSQNVSQCSDGAFLFNCQNCKRCFGCTNLVQKENYVWNKPCTPQEFDALMGGLHSSSFVTESYEKFTDLKRISIHRENYNINAEDCSGDYLTSCKNCHDAYEMTGSEDCRHILCSKLTKDSQDLFGFGYDSELLYDCVGVGLSTHVAFSWLCTSTPDCFYCFQCANVKNCFGCVALRQKEYCIFNTQYTKEDYEKKVGAIIQSMGPQWGEFVPSTLSPFAYNETIAQEFLPTTEKDAVSIGFRWNTDSSPAPSASKIISAKSLPDSLESIPDDVLNWAIECESTRRAFKLTKQELDFYRLMRLPVPRAHPDERHRRRMALRNPCKLWDRPCAKCGKKIQTTYSPDRPETVYCEECYLKEVY